MKTLPIGIKSTSIDSNPMSPMEVKSLKKSISSFESIFFEIMLKSMRDSVQKSKLIDGGNGEDIFRSMLDSEYAKSMAAQGMSEIGEAMFNQLAGKEIRVPAPVGINNYLKADNYLK